MANLTVTITNGKTTFIYGDTTYPTLSMGGSGSPYWESAGGTFSNHLSETPTFYPANIGGAVTIIGRRAFYNSWINSANTMVTGTYGSVTKNAGSNTAWDAYAVTANTTQTYDGFFEFIATEINKERAGGLATTSSQLDPNVSSGTTFELAWHLLANGTAIPKKQGAALTPALTFSSGDKFRVEQIDGVAYFKINGITKASSAFTTNNLYGLVTAKNSGSTFTNPVLYRNSDASFGTTTVFVSAIFPEQPNYSYDVTTTNRTLVSYAEDGSAVYRKKGNPRKSLSLNFTERPYTEYKVIHDFWQVHQKHVKFFYKDVVFNTTHVVVFDSDLRVQVNGTNRFTISFVLKEVADTIIG